MFVPVIADDADWLARFTDVPGGKLEVGGVPGEGGVSVVGGVVEVGGVAVMGGGPEYPKEDIAACHDR